MAVLFWSATAAHADTGILDNIAGSYKTASVSWAGSLLGYANRLFMLLATIELAWSFTVWVLEKNELQSFMAAVTKKIMWIGVFYALLLNGPVWVPAIIDSFSQAGATAGGATGLSPSEVFTTGLDDAATMLAGIQKLSLLDDPATIILCGLSAIVIVLAFAVVAGQLLVALVESYIAVSAGLLFLGFGGSRWTTDFVQKYIGYAVATGVKLFMLYLIIGIGNTQATTWKVMLATIGTPGVAVFNIVLTVMGGAVMLAYLAFQIPAMAAAMLAGSPVLTAGAAAATAGTLGAGIVGVGAAGAASTLGAAKSVGGVGVATGAAFQLTGLQGTSGPSRAVGTLGNMGAAAVQDVGHRIGQAIAPTRGGRMADILRASAAERGAANDMAAQPAPPPYRSQQTPTAPPSGTASPMPAARETLTDVGSVPASIKDEGTSIGADTPGTSAAPGKGTTAASPAVSGDAYLPATPTDASRATPSSDQGVEHAATPDGATNDKNSGAPVRGAQGFTAMATGRSPGAPSSAAGPRDGDYASLIESLSPAMPLTGAAIDPGTVQQAAAAPATITETAQTWPDPPGSTLPEPTAATQAPTVPTVAAPTASGRPFSVQTSKAVPRAAPDGLEAGLRSLQQIRAPQIPSDAAPPATVHIRFDAPHD